MSALVSVSPMYSQIWDLAGVGWFEVSGSGWVQSDLDLSRPATRRTHRLGAERSTGAHAFPFLFVWPHEKDGIVAKVRECRNRLGSRGGGTARGPFHACLCGRRVSPRGVLRRSRDGAMRMLAGEWTPLLITRQVSRARSGRSIVRLRLRLRSTAQQTGRRRWVCRHHFVDIPLPLPSASKQPELSLGPLSTKPEP